MKQKEIKPLNIRQCWTMVNRVDTHEKARIAEAWLLKANITNDEYNALMEALSCLERDLYWNEAHPSMPR